MGSNAPSWEHKAHNMPRFPAAALALCVASSFAHADSADLINGLKKHPVTLPKVDYPKPNIHAALIAHVKG